MEKCKKCAICGNEFLPKVHNAKYCSDECRKIARRELVKQWQRDHREYEREQSRKRQRKYYAKNSERIKDSSRKHYQEHKEEMRAYNRAYYLAHIQERREYARNQRLKKKIKACSEAHNNCLSCDTPDGECRFD